MSFLLVMNAQYQFWFVLPARSIYTQMAWRLSFLICKLWLYVQAAYAAADLRACRGEARRLEADIIALEARVMCVPQSAVGLDVTWSPFFACSRLEPSVIEVLVSGL